MQDFQTPATSWLEDHNIPFQLFTHPGPISSLEQAALERNQQPEQVIRSILFRLSEEEFVMVLVAGPAQISWKRLRNHLGKSRVTMASDDEVFSQTGFKPGSVTPFGLPQPLRILVDPAVLKPKEISLGSGVRGTAIILQTKDFIKALPDAEMINLFDD